MFLLRFVLTSTALLLFFGAGAPPQEWRDIRPLRPTRTDVERILGLLNASQYGDTYDLQDITVSVVYSPGACKNQTRGGWNVPKDTVISYSVAMEKKPRVSSMAVDLRKFRKEKSEHTRGLTYYINNEDGITYSVFDGVVDMIYVYPPSRLSKLHCGGPPKREE